MLPISRECANLFWLDQIASASIVGAGVLGLVFAQVDHTKTSRKSADDRRVSGYDHELTYSSPPPRPATSAVDRNEHPNDSDPLPILKSELPILGPRNTTNRRNTATSFTSHILNRRRKESEEPILEEEPTGERKESVSSRGSWLRRLSTVPNSQISSPRSSIGPESPSITFSHGSAAPILTGGPVQLPPNKLVKRAAPRQTSNGSPISHKELGFSHSLRRPATSHQRSATLQQQSRVDEGSASRPQSRSRSPSLPQFDFLQSESHLRWTHHFVTRARRQSRDISPRDRSKADGNFHSFYTFIRRTSPVSMSPPTLITARMITQNHAATIAASHGHMNMTSTEQIHSSKENSPEQLDGQRKPRRSLSKHFGPPPSWALRTGSIGRRKRQSMENSDSESNVPVPVTTSSHIPQHQSITKPHVPRRQPILSRDDGEVRQAPTMSSRPARKRNCSSPLPPLTPISSFALDLAQIGSSSSSSNEPTRNSTMHESNLVSMQNPVTNQSASLSVESSSSPPISATTHSRLHRAQEVAPSDRASTLVGSDNETRGFYSGEDEDTDFQSDTIFDSFRTGTTGSLRIQNPLETMFDALPSSGVSKNKMASLCDSTLRSSFHESPDYISEEEEYVTTPENNGQPFEGNLELPVDPEKSRGQAYPSSPPALPLVDEDFGRLSLEDDDDDEDWAREAEEFCVRNSLSPPSSSLHSRGASPTFRGVLADLGNDTSSANPSPTRTYSNLFEWSDSHTEKKQHFNLSERPKTEHGMDSAGGRRRGPSSLLLRTHSVPIVPDDVIGHSKSSKMTEDWGDDFFEQSDTGPDSAIAILIPPAIQASQANVLGHVGLIRDVLPIVTELKRLCSLAREKDLLDGPHASLWKEAEGIIALASPDDADEAASPSGSPITVDFDPETVDDRYRDCGFDGEDLDSPTEVLDNKRNSEIMADAIAVRRQSVFLPGDDIFGHSAETIDSTDLGQFSQNATDAKMMKPATFPRVLGKDTAAVARSVMETMHQYRSISDPLHSDLAMKSPNRMPFDTTSLRDFVNRANNLIKTLGEIIRASDRVSQSPASSPRRTESPAFTRVFTDPVASPPRRLPRTKSSTSNVGGSTTDSSPTKSHGQRIHVMTVV